MTKKQKELYEIKQKFDDAIKVVEDLVAERIGADNYAGSSSQAQLDRVTDKFYDCALQDLPGCEICCSFLDVDGVCENDECASRA